MPSKPEYKPQALYAYTAYIVTGLAPQREQVHQKASLYVMISMNIIIVFIN